jgi:hypothetical protein
LRDATGAHSRDPLASVSRRAIKTNPSDPREMQMSKMSPSDLKSMLAPETTDVAVMPSPMEFFAGSDEVVSRRVKDGHHYAADLKRPGKYLLVVHHA